MVQFSDKDIMTDLLIGTKSISSKYHQGVLESANNRIRNAFIQLNNEEINLQKQIFDIMHDKGWYKVEPARTSAAAPAFQPGFQQQGASGFQQQGL